jgi:hypothetical protein
MISYLLKNKTSAVCLPLARIGHIAT